MGALFSLQKDVLRTLFRIYIDKYDRTLLLWAGGIKFKLDLVFFNESVDRNYLNILQWLEENGDISLFTKTYWTRNFDKIFDQIEILKWIYIRTEKEFIKCFVGDSIYLKAAMRGDISFLEWLENSNANIDYYSCSKQAIKSGKIELLLWLEKRDFETWKVNLSFEHAYMEHLDDLCISCGNIEAFEIIQKYIPRTQVKYDKLLQTCDYVEELIENFYPEQHTVIPRIAEIKRIMNTKFLKILK